MPRSKSPSRSKLKSKPAIASIVDRYDLYQRAVQCVEAEIDFVDATFTSLRGRKAVRLREDFCGTGNTSCEWVRRRKGNSAVGLDIDPAPISWGLSHNVSRLRPEQRNRVELRLGNVLETHEDLVGAFDVVLAMNFSYWCFHTRAALLHYFGKAREALSGDGVFFLDYYGGSDAHRVLREHRKVPVASKGEPALTGYKGRFTYQWQQESVNPITGDTVCKIHFLMPDGSKVRDAFTYRWRLWSIPEIRDALIDAGFKKTTVYWEGDDGKGEGDGIFTPSEVGQADPAFIGYISAEA